MGTFARKPKDVREVRIGLIGCGGVVESLHLPALASISDVKISWVCDLSVDRARSIARTWGVGQAFGQIDDCSDVDAVLVATPVGTRREILAQTTERGWHAFCEKPFATSANEHRHMLECAARTRLMLGTGFMRRHHWAVKQARHMVRSKVLGPLREIIASESAQLERTGLDLSSYRNSARASGGGVLVETGCHLFDEVVFVSDATRAEVRACVQKMWNDYEVETIASGHITLWSEEQVALQFVVSGIRPVFAGIAFRCELGEIRLRTDPAKGLEMFLGQTQPYRVEVPHPDPGQQHVLAAFRCEWLHFLEAIRTTGDWDLSRETGLITSDFIVQCGEAARAACFAVQE